MLLDDIANHLSSSVSGLTIGVNLWKIPVPETASSSAIQVSIVEYGGRPALRAMGPSAGAPVAEISRFNVSLYGALHRFGIAFKPAIRSRDFSDIVQCPRAQIQICIRLKNWIKRS